MLLFEVRLRTPSSSDRTLQPVIAPPTPLAAAPYRASGLVLWHFSEVPTELEDVFFLGKSRLGFSPPA